MKVFRILASLTGVLVIGVVFFFLRGDILGFLGNLRMAFVGGVNGELSYRHLLNEKLAEIGGASFAPSAVPDSSSTSSGTLNGIHYRRVSVFSNYPFNNYSAILVDAGSADGLKIGMPVLAGPGLLLGKLANVEEHTSEVQTFFDPSWKSSVYVGASKVRGLLAGGTPPLVTFLPRDSTTTSGMTVVNSDSAFPLGLSIGSLDSVEDAGNDLWRQGKVKIPFDLSSLNEVMVLTDF